MLPLQQSGSIGSLVANERVALSKWYVSHTVGGAAVMHICKHREAAIDAACDLLRQGLNVTEVGPMLGIREGSVLDGDELRRIWRERAWPLMRTNA